MRYDYKALEALGEECIAKVKNRTADDFTMQIGMAASYAMDLIDICKDNQISLDLSVTTEDHVANGIVLTHQYNLSGRKSATKSREDIAKKVGAYELFAIFNSVTEADVDAELICDTGRLKIKAKCPDGTSVCFDPQREIESVLKRFRFSSPGDEFRVFGTLQPFYDVLMTDFLSKI